MQHLHHSHPRLDSWVTVEIHECDGRYMATADLAEDSRDVGAGDRSQEAVRAALRALGEPYASEMRQALIGSATSRGQRSSEVMDTEVMVKRHTL